MNPIQVCYVCVLVGMFACLYFCSFVWCLNYLRSLFVCCAAWNWSFGLSVIKVEKLEIRLRADTLRSLNNLFFKLSDSQVGSYANCSCTKSNTADLGNCGGTCSTTLMISLAITTVGTAITFAGFAAHSVVYQRIVSETDRTTAQGLRQCITRILGTLPSPIIFGYILDSTCITWRETSEGDVGNCWIYDVDKLVHT